MCLESAVATFGVVVVANDVNFKIASIAQRRVSDHCELRLLRQAKSRMRRRVLSMGERGGVWLQLTTRRRRYRRQHEVLGAACSTVTLSVA